MNESSKILLVLDLDETLISSKKSRLDYPEDFVLEQYLVYIRPHLDTFLSEVSKHFHLGVWSSGTDNYVEYIVSKIATQGVNFDFVWGRSRCTNKYDRDLNDYYYSKKLEKLKKQYSINKILIIDDSREKCRENYGNAIYIKPFEGDKYDDELLKLLKYLVTLKDAENVRTVEKRRWYNNI